MTEVREINDADQLDEIRSDWQRLLDVTPGADFFRTWDWLRVYLQHFGHDQRLRVLVVSRNHQPCGILPLVVRREWTKAGPFRTLKFPLAAWGSFYGPIGADPEQILAFGLQHISRSRRDWDLVEMRWLGAFRNSVEWPTTAMQQAGMTTRRRQHESTAVLRMDGTWEQYWTGRKGSWRSNCRRNERKLAESGRIEYVRYRPLGAAAGDVDPRWDLYEQCEQIARSSWQGGSKNGTTLSHESIRGFLRDVHLAAVRAGCIDLNLLMADGQPAAFAYNYCYRGHLSGLRLGFDPSFSRYGVGTILTKRMLKDSFERGDQALDFLPGSLELKRHWRTEIQTSYVYSYYPLYCCRGQLLRLKRWFCDVARSRQPNLLAQQTSTAKSSWKRTAADLARSFRSLDQTTTKL